MYNADDPLDPADNTSDDRIVTLPELDETPAPLSTVTLPPKSEAVVVPADTNTSPPAPEFVDPTTREMLPALPALALPVRMST